MDRFGRCYIRWDDPDSEKMESISPHGQNSKDIKPKEMHVLKQSEGRVW